MNAAAPQAYRVKSVKRTAAAAGAPRFSVVLEAIYYGPDEDGPKVGQVLRLDPKESATR